VTRALKRAADVAGAAVLLVVAAPLLAACAALVKRRSPGPALLAQRREGLGGRPFTLWKLRTMHADAARMLDAHLARHPAAREEWARYRRLTDDPRVVPGIGRWLRRTSLDELPQLWNVLRGDMSLVGPRPFELEALDTLPPETRRLRASVRPGLTGLWQVSGRSEIDVRGMAAIDADYVRRWSLWLDLRILLRTPRAVVGGHGAY
jgi:lipopolysaccharide/colanic/teichoic acid biosynthesis glycosyltransferase